MTDKTVAILESRMRDHTASLVRKYGGTPFSAPTLSEIPEVDPDIDELIRQRLEAMIRKGKSSAQRLMKARILLKSDVSEAGEGWSDNRIMQGPIGNSQPTMPASNSKACTLQYE